MGRDSWLLLGRLKKAVKKICFLLNFNANRFHLASIIGGGSPSSRRRLSFNDRPGLRGCAEDLETLDSPGSSRIGGCGGGFSRTTSFPASPEDDIDQRAELFIQNFYRQLKIERQVSLELRYCRGNSFDSPSPTPR